MSTTTYLLLGLGLVLAVVVLALLAVPRRPRVSSTIRELDEKARQPHVEKPPPLVMCNYTAGSDPFACLVRSSRRRDD